MNCHDRKKSHPLDKTSPRAYVAMVTKGMLLCRGEQGRGQLATLLAGQVVSQNQGHRVTPQDEDESSFPSLQSKHTLPLFFPILLKKFYLFKTDFWTQWEKERVG